MNVKKNYVIVILLVCIALSGCITVEPEKEKNGGIPDMAENIFAVKYKYDEWKHATEGPVTRYHINVDLAPVVKKWNAAREDKSPLQDGKASSRLEVRLVSEGATQYHLILELYECNSIEYSHELILGALSNISNPNLDVERPEGWKFGDVYKAGHWARDNVYVYLDNFEPDESAASSDRIKSVNEEIDALLKEKPRVTAGVEEESLRIDKFFSETNEVAVGESVMLKVFVNGYETIAGDCYYKFFVEGGEMFRKGNDLFYIPAVKGKHVIELFVTDADRQVVSKNTSINVK
jgi:uncharacterized protein YceK